MTFGEKLKKLREEKGLTQEDLAGQLYVSRTAVSKWETNKGYPSIDTIVAIQKLFNVSIDYLMGEEDINESLLMRQRESRRLFWIAIGCFALAVAFATLSLIVYNAGYLPWVLPLRILGALGVVGYLFFAFASKAKYQPKPTRKVAAGRLMASRIIVLLIVVGAIVMLLIGES